MLDLLSSKKRRKISSVLASCCNQLKNQVKN
ncbi:unnamed protein product [Onchocerca flexuosa]|uniref:Uncharacterized protein n=1 Tax=Onchocerca flexuosa TaxID=387005 RepID=A0A183I0V0_9BILA|nr:unnamed protein product [Onchocerca flexuosa]